MLLCRKYNDDANRSCAGMSGDNDRKTYDALWGRYEQRRRRILEDLQGVEWISSQDLISSNTIVCICCWL